MQEVLDFSGRGSRIRTYYMPLIFLKVVLTTLPILSKTVPKRA
jgi:hypothetical protein